MTVKSRLRVAVLFGGRSGEHEVSIASATSVIRALDPRKFIPIPVGITREGQWRILRGAWKSLSQILERGEAVILHSAPGTAVLFPAARGASRSISVDVVFPVLHGTFGEDGTIQGLLEVEDVPYVGAGVLASAVGMDKDVQKRLFRDAGLPIIPYEVVRRPEWEAERSRVLRGLTSRSRFPLFVKPATLGSSVGMSRVGSRGELARALDLACGYALKVLVERAVNAREIEISVLGNEELRASVAGEIIPHREFYDYTAKYLEEGTRLVIPAPLGRGVHRRIQEYALRAFRAIEGTGMARVDFFLERGTGKVYINEVNTIPGFTSISMYPKLWEASGLGYPQLLTCLIELALELHREKSRTRYSIDLPPGSSSTLGA
jgi:D-alanine-D-alanine ligase